VASDWRRTQRRGPLDHEHSAAGGWEPVARLQPVKNVYIKIKIKINFFKN